MFAKPIATVLKESAKLVGICDNNPVRARLMSQECGNAPVYDDFDRMLRETNPDCVIVTTPDCLHDQFIIRSLHAGCDVISEKLMTTDAAKCRAILRATGKQLTVTFNCRFMPYMVRIKEWIRSGMIGDILSVHDEWFLDTRHGADYFRRWHRRMEYSGGLLVHKATHHFDLVNWWLDDEPETVFAQGAKLFLWPDKRRAGELNLQA